MAKNLEFDARAFCRILISYFAMTIFWSVTCILLDRHFVENKFHLKALGFVTLFCLSFILGLRVWNFSRAVILLAIFIITFYFVSFFIGSICVLLAKDSILLSGLIMSSAAATILARVLNKIKRIEFTYICIITTAIFALPAYLLSSSNFEAEFDLDFGIHPSIIMFNFWQGLTIISLSLGLCVTRQQPTGSFEQVGQTKGAVD